jgi:hypothetical protein
MRLIVYLYLVGKRFEGGRVCAAGGTIPITAYPLGAFMMLRRVVVATLTLVFSVALVNCGEKTEKDRVMDFMREFAEYGAELKEKTEERDPADMEKEEFQAWQNEVMEEANSIAEDHGFKDADDAVATWQKHKQGDDPEIKELEDEPEKEYDVNL